MLVLLSLFLALNGGAFSVPSLHAAPSITRAAAPNAQPAVTSAPVGKRLTPGRMDGQSGPPDHPCLC
jgi:hypothetical protein